MPVSPSRGFAAMLLALSPAGLPAQDLAVGLGYSDYPDQGRDGAIMSLDYVHRPFLQKRRLSLAFAATASATAESDFYLGAGIAARWRWPARWFVEASVMPGAHWEGRPANDIGTIFNFRSLIGAGYMFDDARGLSLALSHKSNASLDDINPGADAVLLRYHRAF